MNAVLKPFHMYRATNTVMFDPNNKEHRRKVKFFLTSGGWGEPCPFIVMQPYASAATMCRDMLLNYYLNKDRNI